MKSEKEPEKCIKINKQEKSPNGECVSYPESTVAIERKRLWRNCSVGAFF